MNLSLFFARPPLYRRAMLEDTSGSGIRSGVFAVDEERPCNDGLDLSFATPSPSEKEAD